MDAAGAERFPAAGLFPGAVEALLRGRRSGWRGAAWGMRRCRADGGFPVRRRRGSPVRVRPEGFRRWADGVWCAAAGSARSAVRPGEVSLRKTPAKAGGEGCRMRVAGCGPRGRRRRGVIHRAGTGSGWLPGLSPVSVYGSGSIRLQPCPRLHRASALFPVSGLSPAAGHRVHRASPCSRARVHSHSSPGPGPCYLRMGRMTRAGLPATMVSAGTSCVTTEPAPTMAFSPMVTPGSTTEQAPIQALRRMRIGRP